MQAFFLFLWNHKPAGLPVFTSCCWVWKDKNEILLDQKKKSKAEPAAELLSSSKSIFWYLNYVCLPESSEKFEITLSILNERLVMLFFSLHWVRSVGLNTDQKLNTDTFNATLGIASHQILGSSCLTLINHYCKKWRNQNDIVDCCLYC